jgi:hypothetical protein
MAFIARDASPTAKEEINEMEARALQERLDAEQIDAFIAEELANLDEANQAFDEELAKVTATERLAALRSNEYRLAAQQAAKAAKAVEAAEAARQLAARQLAEKQLAEQQKPIKPQKQPSKKKDPSPSSVIDADLGSDDPDDADLKLAILRSQEDEQVEGREATEKPFDMWINEFPEQHPARAKLYDLFNGRRWSVVNPRGDGFCGLYVAAIDFQNNHSPNTDPRLLERVLEVSRDGLIELIIDGMKKYYEARNRHIALRNRNPDFKIPGELGENKQINVDDADPTSYFELTEQLLETNEEFVRAKLRILGDLANTPEALFVYLPYIYKRSYLILTYDGFRRGSPYLTTFMPCLADVEIDARGNAIYPYGEFTNSAIMFNNGHYFLINNPDDAIKADVINSILANKFSDEPRRLWQNIFAAEGRRLRKRKGRTQKGRTKKGRTKKVITQKPRPHRSLRHKHKHRTHTLKNNKNNKNNKILSKISK